MAKTILVVEDVEDSRAILVLILQRYCGYQTIEAATGTEAIQKALSEISDLIVMDLGLPDIDGMDAARALKANPSTAHIPIIAHTAWTTSKSRDAALNAGMVEYLEKPVPKELMKETIERHIPAA
jgi:two-component system, cell cycle response regulator DivK